MKKNPLSGCTFAILGDSYSTFEGYIPEGNAYYYPRPEAVDDVLRVEDTWWHILMTRNDMQLKINESYSGATVCTTVRDGLPFSSAFTQRVRLSLSGETKLDYIFVFGTTNDSWLSRPIGEVKFSDRTEQDVRQVLPAYCDVIEYLREQHPEATVVSVVNTDLKPQIRDGIVCANAHYGALTMELADIEKQNGHPSAAGMRQIADQIEEKLNSYIQP